MINQILISKPVRISAHCLFPLITGLWLYMNVTTGIIRNHFADGLWAYAFMSAILILWENRPPRFWIVSLFGIAGLFELMQFKGMTAGTGDLVDMITYFIFFFISIGVHSFPININPKPINAHNEKSIH